MEINVARGYDRSKLTLCKVAEKKEILMPMVSFGMEFRGGSSHFSSPPSTIHGYSRKK
jgi:hypothetical protein